MVSTRERLADQAGSNRQSQQSVGHWTAERTGLARCMVDMQGIEVSGQACEKDDVGLGHGPSRAFPLIADSQIVECQN